MNQRTVVVLNTPGAALLPWLDEAAAVLQVWYPGERFGTALASILFGDVEPGGRLPLTFPHAREHLPGGDHGPWTAPTELDYDSDGGIGYRSPGVREHGCVFGFGHGLGYAETRCQVSATRVIEGRLRLTLKLTNLGNRPTVHVAQLYGDLLCAGDRELVGVARLALSAGADGFTEVEVGAEAFARWDAATGQRAPVDGSHRLLVANSSTDEGVALEVHVNGGVIVAM